MTCSLKYSQECSRNDGEISYQATALSDFFVSQENIGEITPSWPGEYISRFIQFHVKACHLPGSSTFALGFPFWTMSKVWQHLYSKQQSLVSVTNWPKYVWGQTCPLYSFLVHTDMEKKEEMKSGLLLDVIVQKSVVIFEPLMTHHWWVSSWRSNAETNKEMKSGLLLDGIVQKSVVILELFASKHENPHTNAEMKDKMRSGLLLDVIVQKSAVVLKPFSRKYKDLHTNMEMKDKMKIRCYGPKEHGLP